MQQFRLFKAKFYYCFFISNLITISCFCQPKKKYFNFQSYQLIPLTDTLSIRDSVVYSTLLKAKLKLDSLANQAWVAVTAPFSKAQPESSLGNWLADDCRRFCNDNVRRTDICILSYSLIGTNYIAPGFITVKDVYNIFNFNNTVLLYQLDGKTLNALCDSIAKNGGTPVSGIQFKIDNQIATDIKINGQSLNLHLVYTIATDDYLPKSKKYALIFEDAKAMDTKYRIRDIIIKSCEIRQQLKQSLIPILDKRIEYAE